ncbi:MAG: endonuclease/exonuclease/phosphatase family protein, partial [Bacteroidota bacterium]
MKIGCYNLNNLFQRPAVFELDGFAAEVKPILKDYDKLVSLLAKTCYKNDEAEIKSLIKKRV